MLDTSGSEFKTEWVPSGFQLKKIRRPRKDDPPSWATSHLEIARTILGPALKRCRIAYLYWCVGWSAAEVAFEMGLSENDVRVAIKRLKKKFGRGSFPQVQTVPAPHPICGG